ncbi:hypothetical protein MMC13_007044 [Lambiella insularis]|nr:hypothetical protein [Lambiella insularis]
MSPLHLAILGGHIEVIETLVTKFGADVLLPVKLVNDYNNQPRAALLILVLAAQLSDPDAASVTRRLLALGASSAQADLNQHTPVTYAVAHKRVQVLKELFSEDPVAAEGALKHVIVGGSTHNPSVTSSIEYAITTGDDGLVLKVPELGVEPTITFDDFLSSYNAKMGDTMRYHHEDRQLTFVKAVEQPVIQAAERDMPLSVQHLLDFGADVNTLDTKGGMIVKANGVRQAWNNGASLLDVVNKKIEVLQKSINVEFELAEPVKLEDDDHYLEDAAPGTYEHWQRSAGLQTAKRLLQSWHEERKALYEEHNEVDSLPQKREALQSLKQDFESLRKRILENGGQTFEELHPDPPTPPDEHPTQHHRSPNPRKRELIGLDITFYIPFVGGITHETQKAYLRFDSPPLRIAVKDNKGFSPFSIAVYRGHRHLTKVIIDIANAQYEPTDDSSKPRRRYLLSNGADSDDGREDDDVSISSELVDETFTIDNVASLTKVVRSKVPAVTMMARSADYWMFRKEHEVEARRELGCWENDVLKRWISESTDSERVWHNIWSHRANKQVSLPQLAIAKRDIGLLQYLLRIEHDARIFSSSEDNNPWILVKPQHFYFALEKGYMEFAAELIKMKGIELPMDKLVEKSGFKEEEKPKYYQGLKLYGKHKSDWAKERHGDGRQYYGRRSEESLVLRVAGDGNLAAVEWLLSDTPAVELALHRAIQSIRDEKKCLAMVDYLIKAIPESLETKKQSGHTPLAIAFSESKSEVIRTLKTAGADLTTRGKEGRNTLHLALDSIAGSPCRNPDELESLIQRIDKPLLHDMSFARCSCGPTGLTPIARWVLDGGHEPEVFKVLTKYMSGEELTMLDGSGQRPLHEAVKQHRPELADLMIQRNPALLHMENAMGQTPLELAESLYIRNFVDHPLDMRYPHVRELHMQKRPAYQFVPGWEESVRKMEPALVRTWRVCRRAAEKGEGRVGRKLVSVNEAQEVAKRLAEKKKRERMEREREEAEMREE